MDIVFKCTNCQVDLEVDSEASGEKILCPSCNAQLVIPPAGPSNIKQIPETPKPEKRFSVPVSDKPVEPLIKKALPPLEAAARDGGVLRVKTIRHIDCKEVGHDKFDVTVTEFLNKVGDGNIVSITPINYSYLEMGTQKMLTDFGVMILYRIVQGSGD